MQRISGFHIDKLTYVSSSIDHAVQCVPERTQCQLRGDVNKKKIKKSKKTLEVGGWVGGWVKCPIGRKKIGKHIFEHHFITFLGEHSNVNNVINALSLCCIASMYMYSWLITLEIFLNFFFGQRGGWVGGVYRIQSFLDFYIFFIFTRPLRCVNSKILSSVLLRRRPYPSFESPPLLMLTRIVIQRI